MLITFPSTYEPAATERFIVLTRTEAPELNFASPALLLALPLALKRNQARRTSPSGFLRAQEDISCF